LAVWCRCKIVQFLQSVKEMGISADIEGVLVTDKCGNPDFAGGFPVVGIRDADISKKDTILLTVCEHYIKDVYNAICERNADVNVYSIDYSIIENVPSQYILNKIKPFVDNFPDMCTNLNVPEEREYTLWSCWWQGEENAPDIVKACWRSWDKYALSGIKRVVITKENFREYIEIPEHVLRKVEEGKILLAHLSDIIRVTLLYRYGGIWLDSTVLLTDYMPDECWCREYDIYTRNIKSTEFATKTSWAIWLLCAQKGELLFRFVMEAYYYYLKGNDSIKYYLTTDYLIGIACNTFPEVERKLDMVPLNNVQAMDLMRHLNDEYDEEKYKEYIRGGFFQKLTRHGKDYADNSVYAKILGWWG